MDQRDISRYSNTRCCEQAKRSSQQRVVGAQIVIHEPTVKLRYDKCGGVDVMLDDFVYVHINYDYRYTCNASRTALANKIVELLRPNNRLPDSDNTPSGP